MPSPHPKATDEQVLRVYREDYIAQSRNTEFCADKLGYASAQSFRGRCIKLGLRLRDAYESRAAQEGRPWTWSDDPAGALQPPAAPHHPTPDPQPQPAPAPEPDSAPDKALIPTGGQPELIPTNPTPPELLDGRFSNPTLSSLAILNEVQTLAREIKQLDTEHIQLRINLNLSLNIDQ